MARQETNLDICDEAATEDLVHSKQQRLWHNRFLRHKTDRSKLRVMILLKALLNQMEAVARFALESFLC